MAQTTAPITSSDYVRLCDTTSVFLPHSSTQTSNITNDSISNSSVGAFNGNHNNNCYSVLLHSASVKDPHLYDKVQRHGSTADDEGDGDEDPVYDRVPQPCPVRSVADHSVDTSFPPLSPLISSSFNDQR